MKIRHLFCHRTVLLSAIVLLVLGMSALAVGAIDINESLMVEENNFCWNVDFDTMSSLTDNKGSTEYTLEKNGGSLKTFEDETVFSVLNGSCAYFINDTNGALKEHDVFFVEADMYYDAYPSSTGGTQTPENYPMSFVTWMPKTSSTAAYAYKSIRINHEGYLCTGNDPLNNPEQVTDVQLPLKQWFNIKFIVDPANGESDVYLDGNLVLTYSLGGALSDWYSSKIRFFDSRYSYSVYMRNVSVYSNNDYRIGLSKEQTADYIAYQTTGIEKKIVDGVLRKCFNLRVVSGLNSLEYNDTGFYISVVYTKNGETFSKQHDVNSTKVYGSIYSGKILVDASELDAEYLSAIAIGDIDAECERIEFIVRPYTTKNGVRKYGDSSILKWNGETSDSYPVFEYVENYIQYTMDVTEDTHTKQLTSDNFGDKMLVEIKNNGIKSAYTRFAYFKFDFSTLSELAIERLKSGERIYFEFFTNTVRTLTDEEKAAGGLLCEVYEVTSDWTSDTLTGVTASTDISAVEKIGEMRYVGGKYNAIDVTDYVLKHLDTDMVVSFKLANVLEDGSGSQTKIQSLESGENVPRLVIYPTKYNHEVNLTKLQNIGYEPWGYAEHIVDEWFATKRDELYAHDPYDTVDLEKVDNTVAGGAYTVPFTKYTSNPSSTSKTSIFARNLDSLSKVGFVEAEASVFDEYGGITNSGINGTATGYFHVETIGNRSYIIDPIGNPFFSVGINTAQLGSNQHQKDAALDKYETTDAFYEQVAAEMSSNGINTYWGGDDGFFMTGKIAKVVGLNCVSGYMGNSSSGLGLSISTGGSAKYLHNNTMNVFDPDFVTFCNEKAESIVPKYTTGEYSTYKDRVLGFYSDNEIPAQTDMLLCYLTIDPSEPVNAFSYAVAWTYLMRATGESNPDIYDITPEISEEFKALVYDKYFECVTEAIDAAGGENFMYIGNRIHQTNITSEGYLRAASKYVDIISANLYGGIEPPIDTIKTMWKYSGKPFIVSEFFSKANDAVDMNGYSLGNQSNAGLIVDTQADRAVMYENYTLLLLESQTCLGWTWYRFRDNDQTIYQDANGVKYRVFDYRNDAISEYYNLDTDTRVSLANMPKVEIFYKGESDTSNLGSNKGIYDNKMNLYEELAASMKKISTNLFGIIKYFDSIH